MSNEDVTALTAFCVNNPELDQLEAMLAEFNIFEAAGLTSQEIRHSRFLSFLLDPKGAHGLGDFFVTKLLQAAVHGRPPDEVGVTALDIELMNLTDCQISCEQRNIDILILSEAKKFAVIIENKISTGEHSNQLPRYLETVATMRPGWHVLPVLLSPFGVEPTDSRYFAVSYESITEILNRVLASRQSTLGADVYFALSHYERLLRRHVVSNSNLNGLCRQIISKHRRAIEILMKHMDDPREQAWSITDNLLTKIGFVRTEKKWLPETWLEWIPVSPDSPNGYILGFWVDVYGKRLRLIMEIQPGPIELRTAVFNAVSGSQHLKAKRKEMTGQFTRILDFELAQSLDPEGDFEPWSRAIQERMEYFASSVLPSIEAALRQALSRPQMSQSGMASDGSE